LKENLPSLTAEDASRLKDAVQAMIEACVAPSADRLVKADKPINVTLMERVRKAVSKHLCSPSLGTAKLCREAATSRSQLYRLLQNEGGVGRYVQRCRLSKSFAILCDPTHSLAIGGIAEMLCFADASTFSRAFRREFGINPSEVRAASLCGLPIAPLPSEYDVHNFRDCLRLF
jgi:AraC-like DNA-binding protein